MLLTVILLLLSAVVIYFSCELFINAVEWFGKRFEISKSAVGSVLAAFGTALPESVVTFVAVVFGANPEQKDIGVGAAIGGPLVLSTIAYAFAGLSIYFFRKNREHGTDLRIDSAKLARDQLWFLAIYILSIGVGIFQLPGKTWIGLLFFASYGLYFLKEMRGDGGASSEEEEEELEPLRFDSRSEEPRTWLILAQTLFSLVLIFLASRFFVGKLDVISQFAGIPAHIIALFLSPIATELPEIINVLIWVRQGKETLALGNISGAMMIQTTIPSGLGMIFTPWNFDPSLMFASAATLLSILFLWTILKSNRVTSSRFIYAAAFYALFVIGVVAFR